MGRMLSTTLLATITHELAHCFAVVATGGEAAITNDRSTFTSWRRDAFKSDTERLAFTIAGPLCDLLFKGILDPCQCPFDQRAPEQLLQYLEALDDGSTTSDASVATRLFPVVLAADASAMALKAVMDIAWPAATDAFKVYADHQNLLRRLALTVLGMRPHECLVIPASFRDDLNCYRLVLPRKAVFNQWLIQGSAEEQELLQDAQLLINEMFARGEMNQNGLTEAGLLRLSMNEIHAGNEPLM